MKDNLKKKMLLKNQESWINIVKMIEKKAETLKRKEQEKLYWEIIKMKRSKKNKKKRQKSNCKNNS
jgi:hypothetical protein